MSQGVDLKIISGDDPKTVCAIARKAHLKGYENFIDMSSISDDEIPRIVNRYTILEEFLRYRRNC